MPYLAIDITYPSFLFDSSFFDLLWQRADAQSTSFFPKDGQSTNHMYLLLFWQVVIVSDQDA